MADPVFPAFDAFAATYAEGTPQVLWTRRVDDLETPVGALLKLGADTPGVFLLESVEGGETRGRYSILGAAPDLVWRSDGGAASISRSGRFEAAAFAPEAKPPLESLRALIAESAIALPPELPPPAAGLFGYLGFEMVREIERLPAAAPDPLGTPDAVLMRPTIVIVFDSVRHELVLVTPVRPAPGVSAAQAYRAGQDRVAAIAGKLDAPLGRGALAPSAPAPAPPRSNQTPEAFMAKVERAKAYIRAGDIFQVVPSQRFTAPYAAAPVSLYRALRRLNPSPFLYFLQMDGFSIVGSSPEILVRVRDGIVTVRPIAGTLPRGATPAEDRANEERLLADPKERAEHLMLLDLGRNDVGRVAQADPGNDPAWGARGGVRVTGSFFVERYSHVMHIVSNVEGRLAPDRDALDALLAGFPAGTVSGAPKVRAMEIITELEPHARGVYAGGVGYFSADGSMDFCIALRTGVVKDGALHVQAGAGVVLDSNPESEHRECLTKARALFAAAAEAARYG
jgi:anthranilate synthase component 1